MLCAGLPTGLNPRRMKRRLTAAATGVDASYKAACVAESREQFITHIAGATRHAKRLCQLLQDSVQLAYVSIEQARDGIIEARAAHAILRASTNTARRRAARRLVRGVNVG